METSLHRQLKEQFRLPNSEIEVKLGRYRIDVVNDDVLVEIQQSGLSSIRDKIRHLLKDGHRVDVVKPLVARKRLIKLKSKDGKVVSRRWSPKRGTKLSVFDELIYFTRVFPHPNLRLIVPLVEIEEIRYPGHGRRRRWRKNDFVVQDKLLVNMLGMETYKTAQDLHRLLPLGLEAPFDTKQLADGLGIARWDAQRIGYVLRKTGSAIQAGKRGNAVLYELANETVCRSTKPTKKPRKKKTVKKVNGRKSAKKKKSEVA